MRGVSSTIQSVKIFTSIILCCEIATSGSFGAPYPRGAGPRGAPLKSPYPRGPPSIKHRTPTGKFPEGPRGAPWGSAPQMNHWSGVKRQIKSKGNPLEKCGTYVDLQSKLSIVISLVQKQTQHQTVQDLKEIDVY